MGSKILIIGACGQIGSELTYKLRSIYGDANVIASDISYSNTEIVNSGIFEIVDAQDYASVKTCVEKFNIDTVYLMAAMPKCYWRKVSDESMGFKHVIFISCIKPC